MTKDIEETRKGNAVRDPDEQDTGRPAKRQRFEPEGEYATHSARVGNVGTLVPHDARESGGALPDAAPRQDGQPTARAEVPIANPYLKNKQTSFPDGGLTDQALVAHMELLEASDPRFGGALPGANAASRQNGQPTARAEVPIANPYKTAQGLNRGRDGAGDPERSASATADPQPLTQAQREQIEANKQNALAIRKRMLDAQDAAVTPAAKRQELAQLHADAPGGGEPNRGSIVYSGYAPNFDPDPVEDRPAVSNRQLDGLDPGTTAKRPGLEPAAQNSRFTDGDILIPEKDRESVRVHYLTREQHNRMPPHLLLTPDYLDNRAVLIKTATGAYVPKSKYFNTIEVDTSRDQKTQDDERTAKFNTRMDELGLSHRSFAETNPERLTAAESKYETPGGTRTQQINFKNPKGAGQFTPDILIRNEDGTHVAVWPKLEGWKTLADAEQHHARENIRVKATGNAYVPVDTINAQRGPMAAEKMFARFTDTQLHLERNDMKAAYYRVDNDTYVSGADYRSRLTKPEHQGRLEADMSKADVLFQSPGGQGLVTSNTLKFIDRAGHRSMLESEGLPQDTRTRTRNHAPRPEVLVRLNEDILVSGSRARELANGGALDDHYAAKDIYIQNTNKNGHFTGSYADKVAYERRGARGGASERLAGLGIAFEPYGGQQVRGTPVLTAPQIPAPTDRQSASRLDADASSGQPAAIGGVAHARLDDRARDRTGHSR
jgi:hypothetical protein